MTFSFADRYDALRRELIARGLELQFWFEYGLGKVGQYMAIFGMCVSLTTLLTVKGIYFPVYALILLAILLGCFCIIYGYFLDTRNVMGRLNSHMNRRGNPEMQHIIEVLARIEKRVEHVEKLSEISIMEDPK